MKAEIGGGAKPAFVAMLKETVLKATATTQPTPPQTGGTFATPSTGTPLPQTSSHPVNSMVISVKVVTSSFDRNGVHVHGRGDHGLRRAARNGCRRAE